LARGRAARRAGDAAAARAAFAEAEARFGEAGNRPRRGWALSGLAGVAMEQGDLAEAEARYAEVLALFGEAGAAGSRGYTLANLAHVARYRGDAAAARAHAEEAVALLPRGADAETRQGTAWARLAPGLAAVDAGDVSGARAGLGKALALLQPLGATAERALALEGCAALAAAQGQAARALRLAGAATALREAIAAPRPPVDHTWLERWLAPARGALAAAARAAAWEEGRALTPDQAAAYALEEPPESDGFQAAAAEAAGPIQEGRPRPGRRPRLPHGLTTREAEVLRLVAAGHTDRQVAAALVLSEATVGRHLTHIFAKLGVTSRAAAAAAAVRAGLA
jgi:DNA-binding CsgD family transcriptional regulator